MRAGIGISAAIVLLGIAALVLWPDDVGEAPWATRAVSTEPGADLPGPRPSAPLPSFVPEVVLPTPPEATDLHEIEARGYLVVALPTNSTSFFLYRGTPMGFEHDLAHAFADTLELEVRFVVELDDERRLQMLREGEVDLVGGRLPVSLLDQPGVAYSEPLYTTPAAVVQAEPGVDPLPAAVDEDIPDALLDAPPLALPLRSITRPEDLAGERVWLRRGDAWYARLVELEDSLNGDIEVALLDPEINAEALVRYVSMTRIERTVVAANVGRLAGSRYQNVEVKPHLGAPTEVGFALRETSPDLRHALDAFLEDRDHRRRVLYTKYFIDRRGYRERVEDEYLVAPTGRLSPYDDLFRAHAEDLGWSWLLLASQAYQESRFDPRAKSWAGARGLMQLMPRTARGLGVKKRELYDPEVSVKAGAKYIAWLQKWWSKKIADPAERTRFVLGAYNAGPGHVEDGRRLAAAHGQDPNDWDQVAFWLLRKAQKKWYSHEVVKHGFCRCSEAVLYVERIYDRWRHYEQFFDASLASEAG